MVSKKNNPRLSSEERLAVIMKASKQVGPGVFYSTIIVVASFLPVFLLTSAWKGNSSTHFCLDKNFYTTGRCIAGNYTCPGADIISIERQPETGKCQSGYPVRLKKFILPF